MVRLNGIYSVNILYAMTTKMVKIFLRLALSAGFLSAVADRFGIWSKEVSVWGNWDSFLNYTQVINPWFS